MSSILAGLEGVTNNFLLGYAIGRAAGPALEPLVQDLANTAWSEHAVKPPSAGTLAAGVAQGQVDHDQASQWAKETGFGTEQFQALVDIANTGPALGLAYQAWRRGELTDVQFKTALKRTGLEEAWYPALVALKQEPLDPAQIATAVHRNIMRDPSLIVREPPTTAGKVPQVPESSLNPADEATWSGIDHERLRVLVGITGLPPGLVQMLQLLNRGEVTEDDVRRAVAQSNLRNEYMDVVLALRRALLTPHNYEEAALRGIISRAEADAGAALSGMEPEDAQLLFEIMGRPLTVHQITTALARGGTYGGTYADIPEPYRDAVRRSNIRPEYAVMAHANRYTYPSAFVLRSLVHSGDISAADGHAALLAIGWPPAFVDKVIAAWAGGAAGSGKAQTKAELLDEYEGGFITESELRDHLTALGWQGAALDLEVHLADARRIKGWRDKAITALGKRYVATTMDASAADGYLQELQVVDPDTRARIIGIWNIEREFK